MSSVIKYWWRGRLYVGAAKQGCGRIFRISPQKVSCTKKITSTDDFLKLTVDLDPVTKCCPTCD